MADESRLQRGCVDYAKRMGCVAVKQDGGLGGMPDYLFLLPKGRTWLVEFKSPTGRVSIRQQYVHDKLGDMGHPVFVVRARSIFVETLNALLGVK